MVKRCLSLVLSLSFCLGFLLHSAEASSRLSNPFGMFGLYSTCFGGYASLGVSANIGDHARLTLGYDYFVKVPRYRQIELGGKWLITSQDFTPFLGVATLGVISFGVDYTSKSGVNFGFGYQTGFCTGPLMYLGTSF